MEKINIANLREGRHEFEFTPSAEDLELGEVKCKDLNVRLTLDKTASQIIVSGKVSGQFELMCNWCTEDFRYPFSKEFQTAYRYDFTGDAVEGEDDNLKFISPKTIYIDLRDDLRDFILLTVPMRAVPGEDNGICKVCGRNINEFLNPEREQEMNPVWEKLIKLKTKE
ncbi:MAG: DUF177 domain-containing protein [Ignavibacteria bacterium]|nr:DUF177 domain-containing protein [Ignavibacteria bacterium]